MKQLKGILSPIITAFDKDGEVYDQGCRNVIDFQLPFVNGFFVCGSYGCGALMSIDERKHVLELMATHINGRAAVIAHVGTTATKTTVELAKHAESVGVDAIAAIPPFYHIHTDEDIIRHYKAIVDAVNLPVFAYNYPKLSNNPLSTKTLIRLSEIGIAGVKDTIMDFTGFVEKIYSIKQKDFSFIIGTEALLLPAFIQGAQACISGMANILPKLLSELYQAILEENIQKSSQLQLKVNEARSIIKKTPSISSAYAFMDYLNIDAGFPRLPFGRLAKEQILGAVDELKSLGVLEN